MRAPRALPRGRLDAQTDTLIHGRVLTVRPAGSYQRHGSGDNLFSVRTTAIGKAIFFAELFDL